jgi:hypothetical protein
MKIRLYKTSDEAALRTMHKAQGFEYEFPDLMGRRMEGVWVAEENGRILAAVAVERIVQTYFLCSPGLRPRVGASLFQAFESRIVPELSARGYNEANAFLPPSIAERFGRRLERSLGWTRNWKSWAKRF